MQEKLFFLDNYCCYVGTNKVRLCWNYIISTSNIIIEDQQPIELLANTQEIKIAKFFCICPISYNLEIG